MRVWHPLEAIPPGRPVWATFAVLLALGLAAAWLTAAPLTMAESKWGIISLELAWSEPRAEEIISAWESKGLKGEAERQLPRDNVFILFYSTLAALGCVMAARAFFAQGTAGRGAALLVAWLPWLAGALDYAENYAIYKMLGGFEGGALPLFASTCAALKFLIITPLGLWGLAGAIAYFVKGRRGALPGRGHQVTDSTQ